MRARAICLLGMPLAALLVAGLATDPPAAGQAVPELLRPRVPLHAAAELHERSQRAGVLRGRVPPLLPAQPLRPGVGSHELGACRQPRPGALGAPAHRARRGRRHHDLLGQRGRRLAEHERARRGKAAPVMLVAIYTGHGHGKQTQNLAYSIDRGRTWTKYAGNPVLDMASRLPRPEGFLARVDAPLGDGHGARRRSTRCASSGRRT